MCQMREIKTANGSVMVAAHKTDCVSNIVSVARNFSDVSQIILFGSVVSNKCRKDSDIDIAVFGDSSKAKMLRSRLYKDFVKGIRGFDKMQNYDILYFNRKQFDKLKGSIKEEINNGIVIYDRKVMA